MSASSMAVSVLALALAMSHMSHGHGSPPARSRYPATQTRRAFSSHGPEQVVACLTRLLGACFVHTHTHSCHARHGTSHAATRPHTSPLQYTYTRTHTHTHLHPPTPRPCSHTAQAKPAGARRPTRPIRPLLRPGHAARHRHGRVKCSICRLHSPALDVLAAGMPTWQGQNYTYLIARFPTHPPCTPLNKPELDNHKCVLVFTSRADRHTQALRSLTYFSPPKGLRVSRVSRALPLLLLHVASH